MYSLCYPGILEIQAKTTIMSKEHLEVNFVDDGELIKMSDLNINEKPLTNTYHQILEYMVKSIDDLYSKCLNQIKFQGSMYPRAVPISDWIISCVQSIYYEAQRDYPIKSLHQATATCKSLENIKVLMGNLNKIPDNLKIYLPSDSSSIEEVLQEDLMLTLEFAGEISNLLRGQLQIFEAIMSMLNKRKRTRYQTSILEGNASIPQEMFDEYKPSSHPIFQTVSDENISNDNPIFDDIQNSQVQPSLQLGELTYDQANYDLDTIDPLSNTSSISTSTRVGTVEQNSNCSTYHDLYPIKEEVLPFSLQEQAYVIKVCKQLAQDDNNETSSFKSSVRLLEDKVGTHLDPYDPDLLKQVHEIEKTQRFFEVMIDNDINPLGNQASSNVSEGSTIYAHSDMSLTPPPTKIHDESGSIDNITSLPSPELILDHYDKPVNRDVARVQSTSSFNHLTTQSKMPAHLGPRLNIETTIQDIDRHQRAFLDPPVRRKPLQTLFFNEEILHDLPKEDQKQILGEEIFPKIENRYPKLAKKLTGMLLDLPNNELVNCINSNQLLFNYIDNALDTLSAYAKESKDYNLRTLLKSTSESRESDNDDLDNSNDSHSGVFQEEQKIPLRDQPIYQNVGVNSTYTLHHPQGNSVFTAPHIQLPDTDTPIIKPTRLIGQQLFTNHSPNPSMHSMNNFAPNHGYRNLDFSSNQKQDTSFQYSNEVPLSYRMPNKDSLQQVQSKPIYVNQDTSSNIHVPNPTGIFNLPYSKHQRQINENDTFPTYYSQARNYLRSNVPKFQSLVTQASPKKQFHFEGKDNIPRSNNLLNKEIPTQRRMDRDSNILPEPIELIMRDKKELEASTFLANRIIRRLSQVSNMSSQHLTDLLSNMDKYNLTLEKLESKLSKYLRRLVDNRNLILDYDPSLYHRLKEETKTVESLSSLLQEKLDFADSILHNEEITLSQLSSHDTKELPYLHFTGDKGVNDPHIYQFITNIEQNFKLCRTPANIKPHILKKKLSGSAALCIPSDLHDYNKMVSILIEKFGSIIIIHNNILELHKSIGVIPSKLCPSPKWEKIESVTRSHLSLIRKAEALSVNPTAHDQIFANANRNFILMNLLAHEYRDDLQRMHNSTNITSLYNIVVRRFEEVLATASNNIDHTDSSKTRKDNTDNKKKTEKADLNDYALTFRGKILPSTGDCNPNQCLFCVLFQKQGIGSNYFQHHMLFGPLKRVYSNNCPIYLSLSMDDRNEFISKNNICRYCLRLKTDCKNSSCGDEHLIPGLNGKKKHYACTNSSCKERVELCSTHKVENKEAISAKTSYYQKYQINMSVAAFTATHDTPISKNYNIQNIPKSAMCDSIYNTNNASNISNTPCSLDHESPTILVNNVESNRSNKKKDKAITTDETSRPLLLDSTEQLLSTKSKLIAGDCKSIFLYSCIPGLTKNIAVLYDSGGGSSLIKSNIPGVQLKASRDNKRMSLKGIGSGTIVGEQYTVLLPLLSGHAAIQVFAVDKILDPLATVDLQPALEYFKAKTEQDDSLSDKTKTEISKAKIFRFVKGDIDLLLGIKHLGLFPKLIHTLSSGLSIFKMVLKPACPRTLFCLGGPYECLQSLQAIFQDIGPHQMLTHINKGLQDWKSPTSLIANHKRLCNSLPSEAITMNIDQYCSLDTYSLKPENDEAILTLNDDETHLNEVSKVHNEHKSILASYTKTYNWVNDHHNKTNVDVHLKYDNIPSLASSSVESSSLSSTEGSLNQDESNKFELIIAFQCDNRMISDLIKFQRSLIQTYPQIKSGLYPPTLAHIKLITIFAFTEQELHKASILFRIAWERWLYLHRAINSKNSKGYLDISLKGLEIFGGNQLCLKPILGTHALETMSLLFSEIFQNHGFQCVLEPSPNLTIAHLNTKQSRLASDIASCFSNTYVSASSFQMIKMLSTEKDPNTNHLFIYKSLTFDPDRALPIWSSYNKSVKTLGSVPLTIKSYPDALDLVDHDISLTFSSKKKDCKQEFHQETNDHLHNWHSYDKPLNDSESASLVTKSSPDPTHVKYSDKDKGAPTISSVQKRYGDREPHQEQENLMKEDLLYINPNTNINKNPSPVNIGAQDMIMLSKEIKVTDCSDSPNNTVTAESNVQNITLKPPPKPLLSIIQSFLDSSHPEPKCESCSSCKTCRALALKAKTSLGPREHLDEELIKSSVYFDTKAQRFCCALPFIEDPDESLAPNMEQAQGVYNRIIKSLKDKPNDKAAIINSFNKLLKLDYVEPLKNMPKELQDEILSKKLHFIPWNVVYKITSVSTPCRIVFNGSFKTKTGKSINNILCKGIPRLNLLPLALVLVRDPILLTMDIQKFYNSCIIPTNNYHLQCMFWQPELDEHETPEIYILKTHTYGMTSSSRVLEVCLERIAQMHSHNKKFYSLLMNNTYVDDGFANCLSHKEAIDLMNYCEETLPQYGFQIKGYAQSYIHPPDSISENLDGEKIVMAIGMIWDPKRDIIRLRIPPLYFSGNRKRGKLESAVIYEGRNLAELNEFVPQDLTLRMVASKVASIWDVNGFTQPWLLGVKHILRLSCQSVNRAWDNPLPTHIRHLWIHKFQEMLDLSKISFPRCTFPIESQYTELTVVACTDMGNIGKLQCFYTLKKISENNYHVQLIYAKSQLKSKRSVPNEELDSICTGAMTLEKICDALMNVDRKILCTDSTVCAHWILKNPFTLAPFQRIRVQKILKTINTENIFHLRGEWNPADCGTKRPESLICIEPGSFFSSGPEIFKLGIDKCVSNGCLKPISEVVLDPSLKKIALDGILIKALPSIQIPDKDNITDVDDSDIIINTFTSNDLYCSTIEDFDLEKTSHHPLPNSNFPEYVDQDGIAIENTENVIYPIISSDSQETLPTIKPNKHDHHIDSNNTVASCTLGYTQKVSERFSFHTYLVNPLKRTWQSSIRTMSIVYHFIRKILTRLYNKRKFRNNTWLKTLKNLFPDSREECRESFSYLCAFEELDIDVPQPVHRLNTSSNHQLLLKSDRWPLLKPMDLFETTDCLKSAKECAVTYFLRLASKELEKFYSPSMLRKHTIKKNGMFYSRHRLLEVSNVCNIMDDAVNPQELGIQTELPCADRYSPVSISILLHFHRKITNHQGVDRTWIKTLSSIYIFQGQALLTDIVKSCLFCKHKLKEKYVNLYGPINKMSLTFSSVNRHIMLDLSGPYYIKNRRRATRGNPNVEKVYLLHSVCLTSFISTIIPVEDYGSESFVNSLHRIGCTYGYPQIAYTDSSKAQLKALLNLQTPLQTKFNSIYEETKIEIRLCGTGGQSHSRHGRIEKSIHLFQRYLNNKKVQIQNLNLFQLESLCSQASCFLNSMPLCHKIRHKGSVSSSLVSPFSFLLGRRSNDRAPAGPPTLPESRGKILEGVANASKGMFNYFTMSIPDLLLRPSNFEESKKEIDKGNLVLFPFEENSITTTYKLGLVCDLEKGSDNIPRIIEVAYVNHSETNLPTDPNDREHLGRLCSFKRFTRKGIHTLCKIYAIDDPCINNDIEEINRNFQNVQSCSEFENQTLDPGDSMISLFEAQMAYILNQA